MIDAHDPQIALDRLLALRPEDLEGWEIEAAALAPDREAEEELDALFAEVLGGWAGRPFEAPELDAAQLLDTAPPHAQPAPLELDLAPRPARRTPPRSIAWAPAALAASLALLAFGTWQLRPADPGLKSLVTAQEATRVHLQFAVERSTDGRVAVEPGRDGATLDGDDAIAMRLALEGSGGYVSLFEVGAQGSQLLYPLDGTPLRLEAGAQRLQDDRGEDLVYRPDGPGSFQYVALVTDEPIDATMILQDVLEAGETRPDLWPRHVLSVDRFTATWSE